MQLLCINTDGWVRERKPLFGILKRRLKECKDPSYGDVVTIKSSYYDEGKVFYNLIEWPPNDGDNGFESSEFIPLSNRDEIEISQKREAIFQ